MSGDYAVLVDRFSAKSGRSWEESHLFLQPIGRNHSEMVKFSEYDELGVIVGNCLIRFAKRASTVIRDRVTRLESLKMSDPLDARPLADRPQSGEESKIEESDRPLDNEHKTVKLRQNTGQQSKVKKGPKDKLPDGGKKVLQGESKESATPGPGIHKRRGDHEMFTRAGFDIDVKTSRNHALIWAVRKGHASLVQRLLNRDPKSIDHKDALGWTPLHWAVFTANLDLFHLFLLRGADIHARTKSGHSMLHLVSFFDVDYRREADDYGGSSLDRKLIGLELLSRGLPVNIETVKGETPLLWAARCGLEDVVVMLVSKGADLDTRC